MAPGGTPPAGGGAALLHAGPALAEPGVSGDYATGVGIVRNVLTAPAFLIATNAGYDGNEVVTRLAELGRDDGFDALEGRYGNMIEMGITDPLRVARAALQNGACHDEGLHQPSPDSSTPQSLGPGPSIG